MAITTLQTIKDKLKYGSRSNLFKVEITPPTAGANTALTGVSFGGHDVLCKSAAIPAMTIGIIEVPFRGRRAKIPGDRTWTDWTATFYSDNAHKLRSAFIAWTDLIRTLDEEEDLLGSSANDYYGSINVTHLKADGSESRSYKLESVFPTEVGAIDLSYDTTDAIEEFTVTFQYHYMEFGSTKSQVTANTGSSTAGTGTAGGAAGAAGGPGG